MSKVPSSIHRRENLKSSSNLISLSFIQSSSHDNNQRQQQKGRKRSLKQCRPLAYHNDGVHLTRSIFLVSVIFLATASSSIVSAMTRKTPTIGWVYTSNQRRLSQVAKFSTSRLNGCSLREKVARTSSSSALSSRKEWTMITDSRELRFMEGCLHNKNYFSSATYGSFNAATLPRRTEGEQNLEPLSARRSSNQVASEPATYEATCTATVTSTTSKSTMSVLEEMIATTYYRTLEENHDKVSSVFRPLLDSIHSSPNYRQQVEGSESSTVDATPLHGLLGTLNGSPVNRIFSSQRSSGTIAKSSSSLQRFGPPKNSFSTTTSPPNKVGEITKNLQSRQQQQEDERPQRVGYGSSIQLTDEERDLFQLLRRVRKETHLSTTLRVAGGWVRDKLLATPEFQAYHKVYSVGKESLKQSPKSSASNRLTSKFHRHKAAPSMGRQGTKVLTATPNSSSDEECQPVDIDIALDDMLGREFADHLNEYLAMKGEETVSVGMVLKNPEKSKHLETATMKVNSFWIDFVNLRAEEYTQDSRIPDLMRIGTAREDAYRRDLTINALFYNINTGDIEDWTGRGFDDLRKGIIATPLPPLTTLLDDPLRVLRSIRFAARLRFTMEDDLVVAAQDERVANALSLKVSRERVGGELDLMLRTPDPVGAIRLLINLKLIDCVFPLVKYMPNQSTSIDTPHARIPLTKHIFKSGLQLLSATHDHLADCKWSPPVWCSKQTQDNPDGDETQSLVCFGASEVRLLDDDEARRLFWYAAFVTPLYHHWQQQQAANFETATAQSKRSQGKRTNRSIISKVLVDELKRPVRDADSVEKIIKASDDIMQLLNAGCDVSATMILLSEIKIVYRPDEETFHCYMHGRRVDSCVEEDPVWQHAMEFRLLCSKVMLRIGPLWRAALCLSIARELVDALQKDTSDSMMLQYAIEGDVVEESQEEWRQGIIERYDLFATALQQIGLVGIWNEKPIADGDWIRRECLRGIPPGPAFRDVMEEQISWMTSHPGNNVDALKVHLQNVFPDYINLPQQPTQETKSKKKVKP